jgi:hypothetical protein
VPRELLIEILTSQLGVLVSRDMMPVADDSNSICSAMSTTSFTSSVVLCEQSQRFWYSRPIASRLREGMTSIVPLNDENVRLIQ